MATILNPSKDTIIIYIFRCSSNNSRFSFCSSQNISNSEREKLIIPTNELIAQLNNKNQDLGPFPIWLNTLILLIFLTFFQIFGYLVLRYIKKT
jgi:hypothetical protein